uniref:Uncharacterized protein n=1 Tax=Cucumis melo TaxID=3656 RepID=A0A9I9E4B4_CUCME
ETDPENWQAVVSAFERIKKRVLNCALFYHPPPAAISTLDNSPHKMPSDFLLPPSTSIP